MKKNIKVYIASPYTKGDVAVNVRNSFAMYNKLVNLGFYPFAPLTSHFIHIIFPLSYDEWMDIDIEWLGVCDCIIRLPGESKGADIEVEKAKLNGIPVFYSIDNLLLYYK